MYFTVNIISQKMTTQSKQCSDEIAPEYTLYSGCVRNDKASTTKWYFVCRHLDSVYNIVVYSQNDQIFE